MTFNEQSDLAYELRRAALDQANKCSYIPSNTTMMGGVSGGFLDAEQIVQRATSYYNFLKGGEK